MIRRCANKATAALFRDEPVRRPLSADAGPPEPSHRTRSERGHPPGLMAARHPPGEASSVIPRGRAA